MTTTPIPNDGSDTEVIESASEKTEQIDLKTQTHYWKNDSIPEMDALQLKSLPNAGDRYTFFDRIGQGGMGEVFEVFDTILQRNIALKILKKALAPESIESFIREAQITSQIQHPGVVPIYDIGVLPDKRCYFTMKKIDGETLSHHIKDLHSSIQNNKWGTTSSGWSLRRLISVFYRICQTIGYAHSNGVIHCDLKPANLMIGEHGEALVLDWGIARVLSDIKDYSIEGTPAYMAPEQAQGLTHLIGKQSDVYALGAILYNILSGHSPYVGKTSRHVLEQVRQHPPPPLHLSSKGNENTPFSELLGDVAVQSIEGKLLPKGLVEICTKAMERPCELRYTNGSDMANALQQWLEGSQRREMGLELVQRASTHKSRAAFLTEEGRKIINDASLSLQNLDPWSPESFKIPFWQAQEVGRLKLSEAQDLVLQHESLLRGALSYAPDLEQAHEALAEHFYSAHKKAEINGYKANMQRTLSHLRTHSTLLPFEHPLRSKVLNYIQGDGRVSLKIATPNAQIKISEYISNHHRMKLRFRQSMAASSTIHIRLSMGSYLFEITTPDHPPIRYPILLNREDYWDGCPPLSKTTHPIKAAEYNPATECYVPSGYARLGSSESDSSLKPQSLWLDAFVIQKYHVTHEDYLKFLHDLIAQGREEDALKHAPRERSHTSSKAGELLYKFEDNQFSIVPDQHGEYIGMDWPIFMIDWYGAKAYAEWYARKSNRPWRLPEELEWEKAACGVDGRRYPWGDGFDPTWGNMRISTPNNPKPTSIRDYPIDESPYGMRHAAGNMCDWTNTPYTEQGPNIIDGRFEKTTNSNESETYVFRGGSWITAERFLICSNRFRSNSSTRNRSIGFRLVRSV